MHDDWAPRPNLALDVRGLTLTPLEAFVLSRLDGSTPLARLPVVTGFPPDELRGILQRLLQCGAVLAPGASTKAPEASGRLTPEPPPEEEERAEAGEEVAESDEREANEPTFRALFETKLRAFDADQRRAMAMAAEEPELSAFCFDPLPAVVKALIQNTRFGLSHARLVARHHRHPLGLEAIAERGAFAADTGVRRWLVRNPQLPAGLARRLWMGRRLLEQYKLAQDRDVPENTRRLMRETMRTRFASAPPDERVELIVTTDGRALVALSGLPVDGKTTSMLCARPYSSSLFIQNVARWHAAPPPLIAHLLRQEAVRRQPTLRTMLKRHPNCPSGAGG